MVNLARLVSLLVFIGISHTNVNAADFTALDAKMVSEDKIAAKIKETNASTSINDDDKSKLIERYLKTNTFLEQTATNNNSIQSYINARNNANATAVNILSKLEKRKQKQPKNNSEQYKNESLSELDLVLITEKANHTAVRAKLDDFKNKHDQEADRPRDVGRDLIDVQHRQQELEAEYDMISASKEDATKKESRIWLILSEYQALRSKIKMLDEELLSQPMRLDLIQAKIDETTFNLSLIKNNIGILENTISDKRKSEAQIALSNTEKTMEKKQFSHIAVINFAQSNTDLSIYSSSIAEKLDDIVETNNSVGRDNILLQEKLNRTRKQTEVVGLSQKLGNALLKERRNLPEKSEISRNIKRLNNEAVNTMVERIQHQDEMRQLKDDVSYIDKLLQNFDPKDHEQIRNELTPLIKTKLNLLKQAIELQRTYISNIDELVLSYQKMQETVSVYIDLVDDKLIWVRNTEILGPNFIKSIPHETKQLLDFQSWSNSISIILNELFGSFLFYLSLLIAILIKLRRTLIRELIIKNGINIRKASRDSIVYTLKVLVLSIVLALPFSLVVGIIGWEILQIDSTSLHILALPRILIITAGIWFYLNFVFVICMEKGLAESHFKWPEASLQLLRSVLPRFTVISCVLIFLFALQFRLNDENLGSSLATLIFVAFWCNFAFSIYRLLDPEKGVLSPMFLQSIHSGGKRLDRIARLILILMSAALIVFCLLGYIFGSVIFSYALSITICFVSVVLILQQLMLRWLYVNYRRLALKTVLEKRAEAQQKVIDKEDPEKKYLDEEFGDIAEEPELDLDAISQDSRILLNVFIIIMALWGLWEIWTNIMPAFAFLDNINLWNQLKLVNGEEKLLPVTLGDFASALLISFIIIIVIRKLPALLEIILLQGLDISPGLRFTIKTLINYALILVGILWVSNLIGISWAKIQWLVAALSLGIGFGLQEIIANFICGIIILFERPIRIGDVVTIGDTDGVVTRIQIRATTIRNWDRKELLVPNKEFITGRLLNWSLSDRVSRIKFPIGIAYGSDVDLAIKLVEEAAEENSNVLEEPAPYVSFEEFGDNSLLLYLRCFIEYNDNRVQTITDLHKVIDQKFRDADISISFPQRDIHLDTTTPLEINLRKDT